MAKRIVERIPTHTCYVEPFCGGSWVFYQKPTSQVEVLNDKDGELTNFWRVIRHHLPEFKRRLSFPLVSREEFERIKMQDPTLLTDVQRATRYFKLQRMGFGGRTKNRTFGTSRVRPSSFNFAHLSETLGAAHRRISRTFIENMDACECIQKYDSEDSFFYIDPPYWNSNHYAVSFSGHDFLRLRDTLRQVKGKFLMSMNDTPEIRELFGEFVIESVETTYSLSNASVAPDSRSVARQELFIHNMGSSYRDS